MSKNDKLPFAGMRDIYPNDMLIRDYIFDIFNNISKSFGFQKYDTPILEPSSIYKLKNDDDIVNEMFVFNCEGKEICLRPEITPSLARLASNMPIKQFPYPLKLYSIGQCFRFETISKLRKREHYQLNCDIVNYEYNLKDDAELIALLVSIFKKLGFTSDDIVIKISSRKVIDDIFNMFNLDEISKLKMFNILDKLEKLEICDIKNKMMAYINEDQINILLNFINNKTNINIDANTNINDELVTLMEYLGYYEILDWIEIDYKLVRGLSYYTGIVFEGFSKNPEYRKSICGGGRYDKLGEKLKWGNNFMLGFGFGDIVITDLLLTMNKIPKLNVNNKIFIIPDTIYYKDAVNIASLIRNNENSKNITVDIYSKQLKRIGDALVLAEKKGYNFVIIIMENEYKNENIIFKNMINKTQIELNLKDLLNKILEI